MAHFCCMILHTLQCFDTDASSRYHFPAHRWRKTQTCALMPCLLWARPCQSWLPRSARRACPTTGRTTTSFCVSQRWCACGCLCACSCAGNWFGAEYGRCLLEKSAHGTKQRLSKLIASFRENFSSSVFYFLMKHGSSTNLYHLSYFYTSYIVPRKMSC